MRHEIWRCFRVLCKNTRSKRECVGHNHRSGWALCNFWRHLSFGKPKLITLGLGKCVEMLLAPDTSWVWRFHRQSKLARTERNAWKWFSSRVLTNSFVNSHWNLIDPWWKISFEKSRSPECSLEDFKVKEASRGINSGCFHHEISCFHNLKVVLDGLKALFKIWLIACAISDV